MLLVKNASSLKKVTRIAQKLHAYASKRPLKYTPVFDYSVVFLDIDKNVN